MNKIKFLFSILFLMFPLSIIAQWTINMKQHFPKNDDNYSKCQTEFLEPNETGRNIIWDFSNATKTGKDVDVKFKILNDSILLKFEDKTQMTYLRKGNSLFFKRLENPLYLISDSIPCKIISLPLSYGKSYNSPYIFHGIYGDKNHIEAKGDFHIYADACGTLILPNDTIKDVIRLHLETNTIETFWNSKNKEQIDSIVISIQHKIDKYYWYSNMFRYPLVESIRHTCFIDDVEISKHEISYIFTPIMQEQYVKSSDIEDNANCNYHINHNSDRHQNSDEIMTGKISDLTIDFDNHNITLNYSIKEGLAEIEITLFDIEGRIYEHIAKHTIDNGYYTHSINCSSLPIGNYILNITTNNSFSNRFIPIR